MLSFLPVSSFLLYNFLIEVEFDDLLRIRAFFAVFSEFFQFMEGLFQLVQMPF